MEIYVVGAMIYKIIVLLMVLGIVSLAVALVIRNVKHKRAQIAELQNVEDKNSTL